MKLGTRLSTLANKVQGHYDHIWDCCCDHGYLGAALLTRYPDTTIHFVDIVPSLMQQLENKLIKHLPEHVNHWQIHCLDVAQLPLKSNSGHQLIVIAGVGGELMLTMLQSLLAEIKRDGIELLLCPVNNPYIVRKTLHCHGLEVTDECLVAENGRYYEVLKLNITNNNDLGKEGLTRFTGQKIWQVETDEQAEIVQRYLNKTLRHYRGLAKSNPDDGAAILSDYQNVSITFKPTSG